MVENDRRNDCEKNNNLVELHMYQDRLANGINIIMVRIKNRFTFFSSQICLNSRKRWKVVATSPGETLKVIHCMLLVRLIGV